MTTYTFHDGDTGRLRRIKAKFLSWSPQLDLSVLDLPQAELQAMSPEEIMAHVRIEWWWAVFREDNSQLGNIAVPERLLTTATRKKLPPPPDTI